MDLIKPLVEEERKIDECQVEIEEGLRQLSFILNRFLQLSLRRPHQLHQARELGELWLKDLLFWIQTLRNHLLLQPVLLLGLLTLSLQLLPLGLQCQPPDHLLRRPREAQLCPIEIYLLML